MKKTHLKNHDLLCLKLKKKLSSFFWMGEQFYLKIKHLNGFFFPIITKFSYVSTCFKTVLVAFIATFIIFTIY